MKTKINQCVDMYTLRDIVIHISKTSHEYTQLQLIQLDDLIRRKEIQIKTLIRERILELRDLSQQLFDWKEYEFSNVYTEFAEEHIEELNIEL